MVKAGPGGGGGCIRCRATWCWRQPLWRRSRPAVLREDWRLLGDPVHRRATAGVWVGFMRAAIGDHPVHRRTTAGALVGFIRGAVVLGLQKCGRASAGQVLLFVGVPFKSGQVFFRLPCSWSRHRQQSLTLSARPGRFSTTNILPLQLLQPAQAEKIPARLCGL